MPPSWDGALAATGGVRMQYAHSRLCSLLENNGVAERDRDCRQYWEARLAGADLSSLPASEEAISLLYEVQLMSQT